MSSQTTISCSPQVGDEIRKLAVEEDCSQAKLLSKMVKEWRRTHCPECKMALRVQRCNCKSPESL